MRRPRYFLNTILGVVIAAGCANAPSEPGREAASASLQLNGLLLANCSSISPFNVSAPIGPDGGTLKLGPHTLVVPRGALSVTVVITASSSGGRGNSIQFGPEGLRFNTPAQLTFSTANCSGLGVLNLPLVVYTDNLLSILELQLSLPKLSEKKVVGYINHFSRYAVAY